MSEKGSEADIEPCRVNVAEVPFADMARGRISSAGRVLSRVDTRPSRSPVAMDEMLELFDNEPLITDNAFHHVANRNYTN
jgi:hypothetical protein